MLPELPSKGQLDESLNGDGLPPLGFPVPAQQAVKSVTPEPDSDGEEKIDPMSIVLQQYKDIVTEIKDRMGADTDSFGDFEVKYLGSVPTDNPGGNAVVAKCIAAVQQKNDPPKVVRLRFTSTSVDVSFSDIVFLLHRAQIFDPVTNKNMSSFQLKLVSYKGISSLLAEGL